MNPRSERLAALIVAERRRIPGRVSGMHDTATDGWRDGLGP